MLAERLISLEQWKIKASKVLMVVTDNGSNMIKAINTCKQMLKKQAEAADETIDSGSRTGTSNNEESVNETEADGPDVFVETDSHYDLLFQLQLQLTDITLGLSCWCKPRIILVSCLAV
jgi:hypothetical protein